MHITNLQITKFRHLNDMDIKIWDRLTAIAWQNWTWKSTILWLLWHICKEKTGFKSFNGTKFETEYSEIFKFSFPDYDKPKEHLYEVSFDDWTSTQVASFARKERWKDESLRLRVWKSSKEWGKIDFPVIFLGLKRLIPLAQERKVDISEHTLSDTELEFYKNSHNEILLMSEEVTTDTVKSSSKHFLAAKSDSYDAIWNSAWQDNIWQIITSIISFQRLKENLWDDYKWGILLIDELDASMFPAAQEKLISFLYKASSLLDLQCVFTTHSIEIIEILLTSRYKHQSKVCYLHKANWIIENSEETKIGEIIADLKAQVLLEKTKETKIEVYVEDKEAEQLLKYILTPDIKKKINIINENFWAELLLTLANKRIPAFKKSIIVLDWDKCTEIRKPIPPNVIILPWWDSPEKVMFPFLQSLPLDHPFWWWIWGYTNQVCFRDRKVIWDRKQMKDWWKKQVPFWWVNWRKLFSYWKSENTAEIIKFNNKFNNKLEIALKNIYR